MSWLTSFLGRGKQILSRIGETITAPVRTVMDWARGKPVSTGAASPPTPEGQPALSATEKQQLAIYGEVQTPWGTVRIDPEKVKSTIAGNIPDAWLNDVRFEQIKVVNLPNIWEKPFHYKIQFRVLEMGQDARGSATAAFHDKWVTVVSASKLTAQEVIARGAEISLSDYSEGSPPVRGAIAAVDTIAPVFYEGADSSTGAFSDGE